MQSVSGFPSFSEGRSYTLSRPLAGPLKAVLASSPLFFRSLYKSVSRFACFLPFCFRWRLSGVIVKIGFLWWLMGEVELLSRFFVVFAPLAHAGGTKAGLSAWPGSALPAGINRACVVLRHCLSFRKETAQGARECGALISIIFI